MLGEKNHLLHIKLAMVWFGPGSAIFLVMTSGPALAFSNTKTINYSLALAWPGLGQSFCVYNLFFLPPS